jgi:guanylate kinase
MTARSSQLVQRQGIVFILSAPSGAGKTTLYHELRKIHPEIKLSVSCTTRVRREGERDGWDYHFISARQFDTMRARGEFAEWANVHGNLYGTPRKVLDQSIRTGRDILLDIDVQGARKIKSAYPDAVSIFVLPPSLAELKRRLSARGTDDPEVIRRRLANAQGEMGQIIHYDYFIVNRRVEEAIKRLCAVVEAERGKVTRVNRWKIRPLSEWCDRSSHEQRNKNHRSHR